MAESETTTSFPISLRPWQREDDDSKAESLDQLIFRMHTERKGFRHITEERLQQEIRDEQNGESRADVPADAEAETKDEDEKGNNKFIAKKRMEMLHYLHEASEETGYALDSLSLLESKYMPAQAIKTFSPALKSAIEPGTLSYDKWNISKQNVSKKNEQEATIFKGSMMSALTSTADSLLQAASRLEKDVKRETEYWEQVLSLNNAGYPVFKLPGDQRTLAVQFGAAEAGPLFRDRGIAALRANEDGTVKLNQSLTTKPKTIRIRVMENSKLVSNSVTAALPALAGLDTSLKTLVRQAQDSLFEEELFNEMVMESRILQPLGVKLRGDVLHIPLSARQDETTKKECLVDLVSMDGSQEAANGQGNDTAKEVLAVTFRLLLCHVYRQRLRRRSQIPPPLSERKRSIPPSAIIRPVMAVLQHESAHQPLNHFLASLEKSLKATGLPVDLNSSQVPALSSILRQLSSSKKSSKQRSTLHSLLDELSKPLTNSASLTVPSSNSQDPPTTSSEERRLTVSIKTNMSAPLFGTEYTLSLPKTLAKLIHGTNATSKILTFDSVADLKSYMCKIIALDISTNVLAPRSTSWTASDEHAALWRVAENEGKKGRVGVRVNVGEAGIGLQRRWLGGGEAVSSELWKRSEGDEKKGLVDVFDGWTEEYMEVE